MMLFENMSKEQHEHFVQIALAMCHKIYGSKFDNMPREAQIAFAVWSVYSASINAEEI